MPKPEWGVKRTCPNCETRFYDLQRQPILCPECGATFDVDEKGKVSATRERRAPVPVAEDAEALVEDDLVEDDDEDEEEDPLLADDEDDEEPASPALAEEDDEEDDTVAFKDPSLIEGDDLDDDNDDDEADDEEIDDLDEVPGKEQGG